VGKSVFDFIEGLLEAIVGSEIVADRLQGKAKLDQDSGARDRPGPVLLSAACPSAQSTI
jgi:predicted FMN-binding regulatory protein PaiB